MQPHFGFDFFFSTDLLLLLLLLLFVVLLLDDDGFTGVVSAAGDCCCCCCFCCISGVVGRVVGASTGGFVLVLVVGDERGDFAGESFDTNAADVLSLAAALLLSSVELGEGNGVVDELVVAFKMI